MHLVLLALALGPARAGDLELTADRPVWIRVDDRPARRRPGDRQTWVVGLADGEHRVEVRNLVGRPVASLLVQVQGEERVVLRYERGALLEVGRGRSLAVERAARELTQAAARAAAAAAEAAAAEARAAEADARAAQAQAAAARAAAAAAGIQSLLLSPGFGEARLALPYGAVPAPPDAAPVPGGLSAGTGGLAQASASWTGLDPDRFAVRLDGRLVPWQPHLAAFVATDLSPGTVGFELSLDGQLALSADFTTQGGQHTACTVLVRPDRYDTGCTSGGAPLTETDLLDRRPGSSPPAAAAASPTMEEALLQVLVASVAGAPYEKHKVQVLASAAERHRFTCAQVVRLLQPIAFNNGKVEAVRALRPAIVDPENAFLIEEAFAYAAEKEAVRALFTQPDAPVEPEAPAE